MLVNPGDLPCTLEELTSVMNKTAKTKNELSNPKEVRRETSDGRRAFVVWDCSEKFHKNLAEHPGMNVDTPWGPGKMFAGAPRASKRKEAATKSEADQDAEEQKRRAEAADLEAAENLVQILHNLPEDSGMRVKLVAQIMESGYGHLLQEPLMNEAVEKEMAAFE